MIVQLHRLIIYTALFYTLGVQVMRRYKASVAAVTTDQITIQDQSLTIQTLECERNKLREQYAELCQRWVNIEGL